MRYWSIVIIYTLLFSFLAFNMMACTYKIEPNTTSMEIGKSENGKEKITKSLKQTWKWSRVKKLIAP